MIREKWLPHYGGSSDNPPAAPPLCTTFAKAGRVCLAGIAALRASIRGSALQLRQHGGVDRIAA
jgi:hypothetical protein